MTTLITTTLIGLVVLLLASGSVQQKTLNKWTQDTGRSPMIDQGRGSWHRYLRSVEAELPRSVSRKIEMRGWVGKVAIVLMLVLVVLDAATRAH